MAMNVSDVPAIPDWVEAVFAHQDLQRMGHGQDYADRNLGLGWLYYALVRMRRPARVVCIGSWRGFVPIVMGQALKHNGGGGRITFIEPSLVDDFWADADRARSWFQSFGLDNIDHHRLTTQAFVGSDADRALEAIGVLFIDGYHTADQARFDHETFAGRLIEDSFVLFHDSLRPKSSGMYGEGKRYVHSVHRYIEELKRRPDLQVIDFPFGAGVSLVRRAGGPSTA